MTNPEIFTLTREEKQSGVWRRLLTQMTKMRDAKRAANDHIQPEAWANKLRGEITMLNELIALDEDRLPIDG